MSETPKYHSVIRHWPFAAAGFAGPMLAVFASRFLPFPVATGVVMFLLFTAAVVIVEQTAAQPRAVGRSFATGVVAGLAAGIASFGLTLWLRGW